MVVFIQSYILLITIIHIFANKCNLCERYGLAKRNNFNPILINKLKSDNERSIILNNNNHNIFKRNADIKFRGHPKTKGEIFTRKFNIDTKQITFDQSLSLIKLLNMLAIEYLNKCSPYIFYDRFVEDSESFILQNLFQTFPLSFYQGKINERYQLENRFISDSSENGCRSYILFLSDPVKTRKIIGAQVENRVIVVARSSQWKLRDFLTSEESSNIINLLVIGESLAMDPTKERPYVLYTHRIYSDGLGSNIPIVLTSWVNGYLSRPHVDLFPPKLANGFAGHRFVVSAVNQPPYIFRRKTVDNTGTLNIFWEGIEYRLLKLLSKKLNFTYDIVEPTTTELLGSGTAVVDSVERRLSDIGMAGVYMTPDRVQYIDMSVGHSTDCASFITLASKALPKYRAIMGPFQWQVWVALTAVYLLGIFPLAFTDRLSLKHLIGNWGEMENMFWYVFGTFTNSLTFAGKYSWSNSEKMSTRLLVGFYWLFTIIITACYTGSIIAFVTLPAFPDTTDSVNDLLGLFFRVGTLGKGGWEYWFLNSSHPNTERLFKKMEFVGTLEEGIGNVTQSFFWNYAFLGSKSQLEYLVQSNFSKEILSKRSALHLSEECFAQFQVGYTFPKDSVYTKVLSNLILRIQQSGLILKLFNEVSWTMQRSQAGQLLQANTGTSLRELIQEERQLTTADTEGMFLLMAAGYLLAALALLSEVIGGFTNKCRQIVKRSRKSMDSSFSSKRNSTDLGTPTEIKKHLQRKMQRQQNYEDNKIKSRFGLAEFNLTKATLKEIYGGGGPGGGGVGNQKDSNVIMQSGKYIFENDARSDDSSVISEHTIRSEEFQKNDWQDKYESCIHEAVIHLDEKPDSVGLKEKGNENETLRIDPVDTTELIDANFQYLNDYSDSKSISDDNINDNFGEIVIPTEDHQKKYLLSIVDE